MRPIPAKCSATDELHGTEIWPSLAVVVVVVVLPPVLEAENFVIAFLFIPSSPQFQLPFCVQCYLQQVLRIKPLSFCEQKKNHQSSLNPRDRPSGRREEDKYLSSVSAVRQSLRYKMCAHHIQ